MPAKSEHEVTRYPVGELDDHRHHRICDEEGNVLAYAVLLPDTPDVGSTYLVGLHVEPEHRQKGMAKALLRSIEEDFETCTIFLQAHPYSDCPFSEEELQQMYERLGFHVYEEDGWMKKQLGESHE
jgi:ribosomal protein S18 acetylase RimI-like enzyme